MMATGERMNATYLWPNFWVLELAPTTAKNLDEKNVLMEASVVMVGEMGGELDSENAKSA